MSDVLQLLADAINSCDASRVTQLIAEHPELKGRLNDALPGGAFGATPLLHAMNCKRRDVIEALLNAGADINQRSHWWAGGFGVLDTDDRSLTAFLIERGAMVDAYAAARLGIIGRLHELITANPAVVHMRGGDGQTPLHVASTVEIADLLLDHGADIDAIDVDHESTPAQYLLRDHQDVTRHLVARGCRTDILMLCALGDVERVRRHLDAAPGAVRTDVSDEYFPMRNPRAGGTIYVWVLGKDQNPLAVSRAFGHEDVFELLMSRSPEDVKLAYACGSGDAVAFRVLLDTRPNLSSTLSARDLRRLPRAAERNNAMAVRLMLEAGWPVAARGEHGSTALHWAAWHGNPDMVREILKHDPPLEAPDASYGGTPLDWALHGSKQGWHRENGDYAAAIELLLDAGARAPALTDKLAGSDAALEVLRRRAQ